MFNENGTVFAYAWNAGARVWDKVGEVMGAPPAPKALQAKVSGAVSGALRGRPRVPRGRVRLRL